MSVELKPCPFCGGSAWIAQEGTSRHSCVVECESCGAQHESGDEGSRSGNSWNRREGERAIEQAARKEALESACSAIKAADDKSIYIYDSNDCIAVIRALMGEES